MTYLNNTYLGEPLEAPMSLPDQLADAAVSMPGQENAVAIPEGYVRVPILNMVVKKETALLLAVVAAVAIYYITKKKDD